MKVDWSDARWTPVLNFSCKATAPHRVVAAGDPAEFAAEVYFPDGDLARRFAAEGGECVVEGDECVAGPYRLRFAPGVAAGKTVSCSMRATPVTPATPA